MVGGGFEGGVGRVFLFTLFSYEGKRENKKKRGGGDGEVEGGWMTRINDCRRSGDCELEFGCVCVCARAYFSDWIEHATICTNGPVFGMM